MRLLRPQADRDFSLVEVYGKQIPQYAILSHTWGADDEEVSFEDIVRGIGKGKAGYNKLLFCAEQAAKDGLNHFWVDTCCIDKASSTELSEAINSMFRWYRDAVKCYVYLVDLAIDMSVNRPIGYELASQQTWNLAFRQSKWFTRGWTLQELLAPRSVEFFSAKGERLGDRESLCDDIHEATQIPTQALQGSGLSLNLFSVDERLSWAANRETKREEDAAYSLMGLFDLHMPLLYGEGRKKAFIRLHREIKSASASEPDTILVDYPKYHSRRHFDDVSEYRPTLVETRLGSLKRTASEAFSDNPLKSKTIHASIQINSVEDISELKEIAALRPEDMMQRWWDEAIAGRMNPSDEYHKVAVLLVKWADELDELLTRKEVDELETVFRERFHFHTETVELDVSSKPQHQLDRHTTAFIESHDGPHNLLIVFYSGHSVYNELYGRLELSASLNPAYSKGMHQYAFVNWRRTEDMLRSDDVDGDVLMILDASYASNLVQGGKETMRKSSTKRLCELISACPINETTAAPGPSSFTRALIDTLTDLSKKYGLRPFSTVHLNQRICMLPQRIDTPSQVWSLFPNERHIALSPMKAEQDSPARMSWPLAPARSYLKLGLAFRNEILNQQQIELLTMNLTKALQNKEFIGLQKIDWLGIECRPAAQLEQTSLAKTAIARWRRAIEKKRKEMELRKPAESVNSVIRRELHPIPHTRPKSMPGSFNQTKVESITISEIGSSDAKAAQLASLGS